MVVVIPCIYITVKGFARFVKRFLNKFLFFTTRGAVALPFQPLEYNYFYK